MNRITRVLIAEDDPSLGQLLVRILDQPGYQARWVGSYHQALALVEQGQLEVLVTDLRLGDGDGVALIEAA